MKENKAKSLPVLYPNAAGIDISSRGHHVAVPPGSSPTPVREFGGFTEDLRSIACWLSECGVDTVAMEATGIYWVSLYLVLEDAGLEVVLVNARHVKNVRGKKTDVGDAEWIRQLHSCGLLSASFQPDASTRKLRALMRHRKNLVEMSATLVRMMQKALEQMNVKLQHVIADITGKSGQAIIGAMLKGERDPLKLASLCDSRIRKDKLADVARSLAGIWKDEHLFELEQGHSLHGVYQTKIAECDREIELHIKSLQSVGDARPGIAAKPPGGKNGLGFDAGDQLLRITGTDLSEIFGITATNATEIISEVGLDMSKWPTAGHFTSWLNLAPNNRISGGKLLSSKVPKKKNRAGQVFRMAAYAVQRSKNWLAMFYHRIKAKKGAPKAIVATARKIAVIFYKMLRDRVRFEPLDLERYNEDFKKLQITRLKRRAKKLGVQVVTE